MKTNKNGAIVVIVMGAIFAVGAIVCAILGFTLGSVDPIMMYVIAGMCDFLALFCIFFGLVQLSAAKKRAAAISDTSSLAHKTYGNGGNYVHFVAYLNRDESDADQAGRTVAKNVIGAISLVTLGVGVFGTARNTVPLFDVFVSPEEIILKQQNNDLSDAAFRRIPVAGIINIMYQVDTKHERVFVVLQGGRLSLDIPVKTPNDRVYVHSVFDRLKKLPEAQPVQQVAEEQPAPQEEGVQQTPAGNDDVFDV